MRKLPQCFVGLLPCVALSLGVVSTPVAAEPGAEFQSWLDGVRTDAVAAGISVATFEAATTGLEPNPRVIELDRNQPEFKLTLAEYLAKRVTPSVVEYGAKSFRENAAALAAVGGKYRVQPRFIAAIWGMETSYGRYAGDFSVIRSLATLAFDTRRPQYFRGELLKALKIVDEGHITADAMMGSWAGAMGQSQFMPSSFLAFAEDFDGDGRRDIWQDKADVFASIAHYLAKNGWNDDLTWGRPVMLPADFDVRRQQITAQSAPSGCKRAMQEHSRPMQLAAWQDFGLRRLNLQSLPLRPIEATLVQPDGPGTRAYLAYDNFRAILSYNCSNYYAVAVGTLADAIAKAAQ